MKKAYLFPPKTPTEVPAYYVSPDEELRTWIISDTHFGHKNIIKYCNRPFESVEEMNELILTYWNNTIGPDDLVFFVGDLAFGRGSKKPRQWLTQLNGRKIYLKGSHDGGIRPTSEGLVGVISVSICAMLYTDTCSYLLVHDTINRPRWWKGWVVHGHNHNNRPYLDINRRRINVSCEAIDYRPITVRQLIYDTRRQ